MNNNININILIRALIESVVGWVLLALILSQMKDIGFVQALLMPHAIITAVSAFVGGCISFRRKALKEQAGI